MEFSSILCNRRFKFYNRCKSSYWRRKRRSYEWRVIMREVERARRPRVFGRFGTASCLYSTSQPTGFGRDLSKQTAKRVRINRFVILGICGTRRKREFIVLRVQRRGTFERKQRETRSYIGCPKRACWPVWCNRFIIIIWSKRREDHYY